MKLTATQLRSIIKEEVEAVRKQSLTEARLRASIRHQTRLALNESPAEVAEVVADAMYRGVSFHEMVEELGEALPPETVEEFADSKKTPEVLKVFEDALASTGEFDIDPSKAWLEAWRAANASAGTYAKN